jgi:cytokinesis protein
MMMDAPKGDLQLRIHVGEQLIAGGIKRIQLKIEAFNDDIIDWQIKKYRGTEAIDYEGSLEAERDRTQSQLVTVEVLPTIFRHWGELRAVS